MKQGHIPKGERKTILFLADDLRLPSGIGNMTKELILGSAHVYNYVQVAGGINHPEMGQILDISADINKEVGIEDSSVILYPYNGYGDPDLIRLLIDRHNIDAIVHFTDPRYWIWLYHMSAEIRQRVPIFYYHIWDDLPAPHYNKPYYESCDLLMGISKQSVNISHMVLGENNFVKLTQDTPDEEISLPIPKTCYIPHGINHNRHYPIDNNNPELIQFKNKLFNGQQVEYAILYNNRNIRRKMTSDLLLAYKMFFDKLTPEQATKTRLVLHTEVVDEHGTDLPACIEALCPELEPYIIFTGHRMSTTDMNLLYNSCDVVINIASNEGWGLSSTEALLTGKPIINNTTGGLQDQMRFEDESGNWIEFTPEFGSNHTGRYRNHGVWAKPVYPAAINLQGSIPTPYIFDDRCSIDSVAQAMNYWYEKTPQQRVACGQAGRDWAMSQEANFTADAMSQSYIWATTKVINNWKPLPRFALYSAKEYIDSLTKRKTGITLSYE